VSANGLLTQIPRSLTEGRLGQEHFHSKEAITMAITTSDTRVLARFTAAPSMTSEKYDESIKRLKDSGSQWPPDGLAYHIAFSSGGNFRVSEIWDSQEQLETFGKQLMPILSDVGVELAGEPEVLEIHNIIQR
jgi:hypothetical protein